MFASICTSMLSLSLSSSSPSSSAAANYHQPSTINNKHLHHCHHRSQVLLGMASSTCSTVVLKAMDGTTVNLPATGWTVNSHWNGLCIFNCSLDSNTYLPPSERTLKRGNRFNIYHNNSKVSIKISNHNRVQKRVDLWPCRLHHFNWKPPEITQLDRSMLCLCRGGLPWRCWNTPHTFSATRLKPNMEAQIWKFWEHEHDLFHRKKCVVCWQVSGGKTFQRKRGGQEDAKH